MWQISAKGLFGNWRRKQAILALSRLPPQQAILALVEAMDTYPSNAIFIIGILEKLIANHDGETIEILWRAWVAHPKPALATILARVGWPIERPLDKRLAQAILALINDAQSIKPTVNAILRLADVLPEHDETINDGLYAAWIYSQSKELEQLISVPKYQPGSPAMEALYALVTGNVPRYLALADSGSEFLTQAIRLAPPEFLDRIAKTVAETANPNLRIAYRKALAYASIDHDKRLAYLKLIGDEIGLYEQVSTLHLWQVLELCERWYSKSDVFAQSNKKIILEKVLATYRELKSPLTNNAPALPNGMVDIFSYWQSEQGNEFSHNTNDPLTRAHIFYLNQYKTHQSKIEIQNNHWIERLITCLVNNKVLEHTNNDPVCWLAAWEEDIKLLQTNIAGTPADYLRNTTMLQSANETIPKRTLGLLIILCTFQAAFIGTEITVEALREPSDQTAIRLEDVY